MRHTMAFFTFNFLAISLVTLNKSLNLTGFFGFSIPFSLACEKVRFNTENTAIRELIAPLAVNQMSNDLERDVIKVKIPPLK